MLDFQDCKKFRYHIPFFLFSYNLVYFYAARPIKRSGECGVLYIAEPVDACSTLTNNVSQALDSPFVLIIRGGCTFDAKVRSAQNARFKAAIIYDNEDSGALISSMFLQSQCYCCSNSANDISNN